MGHPRHQNAAIGVRFLLDGGYEYTLVLAVAGLTIAFTGPGAFSLDALLGHSASGTLRGQSLCSSA